MMAGHDDTPSVGEPSVLLKETKAERRRRRKEEKRGKKMKEVIDYFHSYGENFDHDLTGSPLSALVVHSVHPSNPAGHPCAAILYKVDFLDASPEPVGLGNFSSNDRVVVLGSCNGLVALYKHPGAFCLFNPELDKGNGGIVVSIQSELDNMDLRFGQLFGLCHDKVNDGYKALICDLGEIFDSPTHHLVNFKSRGYVRKIQDGLENFDSVSLNIGTLVEGVPYWICDTFRGNSIFKFDPITDELCNVPLVPKVKIVESLGALDGQLTTTIFGRGETMEVWSLTEFENGLHCCWTLLFVIPPRVGSFSPLTWIKKEHQLLGICGESTLIVYSLLDGTSLLFSSVLQKTMMRKGFRQCMLVAYTPSSIDPTCLINSDDLPAFQVDGCHDDFFWSSLF